MLFQVGFKTDIGRKRTKNQDAGIVLPELGLFVVADGMGGHRGGEIASLTAIETISQSVRRDLEEKKMSNSYQILINAFKTANEIIFDQSSKDKNLFGMGTTTIALLFQNQELTIAHVGDSRCYFLRPDGIWQITRDHSLVEEKAREGLITRESMKTDPNKNVITRSVGVEKNVDTEIYQMQTQMNDLFLICSDGLTGFVENKEILEITQKYAFDEKNIQKATEELINLANQRGGADNITIIMTQLITSP